MAKIGKSRSVSNRIGGLVRGIREAIPVGIAPILRRFWKFTKKQSKEFAKHLKNPQEEEEKLIKAVIRKFRG